MAFYKKIRDCREDSDITQTQIAEYLGVRQVQYSRWERGEREFPIHAVIKLSDYYNVSVDYLLGLTKVKERYPR